MRYFISFFFVSTYLFSFDYHLKPYTISKGIRCFFGLPSQVSSVNGGNMVNSCYIETKDGYVVIDSGPTYQYAQTSYSIMQNLKNLPVKYVINTSLDEVHILGNSFYKEQGATLLGPKSYQNYFQENRELLLAKKLSEDTFYHTRLTPLDIYLTENRKIDLGGLEIDIKLIRDDDEHLVVHIPSREILFSGDMIYNNRLLEIKGNRSIRVWRDGLKSIKGLNWKDMVSSHGVMTKRSALKNTESYLALLENEVKDALRRKETKEEAVNSILLSSFSEDKLYDFWHFKNVASVYDELAVDFDLKGDVTLLPLENSLEVMALASQKGGAKAPLPTLAKTIEKKEEPKREEKKIIKPKLKAKLPKKSSVHYVSFARALKRAKSKHKIVFLKIRSTTCRYCDQLDRVIANNKRVKKLLNRYFEVVKVNTDYDDIPLNLTIRSTPTIVFIRPSDKKVLMQLPGIRALGEFFDILNEVVDDAHSGGYLKR